MFFNMHFQLGTQGYNRRPYGVGLLVAGYDDQGPHIYQVLYMLNFKSKIRKIHTFSYQFAILESKKIALFEFLILKTFLILNCPNSQICNFFISKSKNSTIFSNRFAVFESINLPRFENSKNSN